MRPFALIATFLCVTGCQGGAALKDAVPYQGVTIGETKAEVLKGLGAPSLAFGEKDEHLDPENQHPVLRNPDYPPGSARPEDVRAFTGTLEEYDTWHYMTDDISKPMVVLSFDKVTDKLAQIQCGVAKLDSVSCDSLMGIDSFSTKDDVLKQLGPPEKNTPKSDKQWEAFEYPSKGVEFVFNGDGRVGFLVKKARVSAFSRLPFTGG